MSVIDNEGRLFRKINVVDFMIILVFLIIMPIFFFVYAVSGKIPTKVPHEWIRVEVVTFTLPEVAQLFKEGDILYGRDGNPEAKLLKITKKTDAYKDKLKSEVIKKEANLKYEYMIPVFLEFELLCTFSASRGKWYYQIAPLVLGLKHKFCFVTDKYSIDWYPLKIGD